MREHDEEDLPILDAVVRGGDAAIISSLRQGRETLAELEALRSAVLDVGVGIGGMGVGGETRPDPAAGATGADARASGTVRPGRGDGSPVYLDAETMRPRPAPPAPAPGAPIDVLLERQVDALRRELRELLCGGAGRGEALD